MEYWGHVSHETKSFFYTWTIEKYEFLKRLGLDNGIKSSQFPNVGSGLELQLSIEDTYSSFTGRYKCIKFHTLCNQANQKGLVQMYLQGRSADCKFGDKFAIPHTNSYYTISIKNFLKERCSLTYDKLIIHCEITLIGDRVDKNGQQGSLIKVPNCKLAEDLGAILNTKEWADVTIITADGLKIPVHKTILSGKE